MDSLPNKIASNYTSIFWPLSINVIDLTPFEFQAVDPTPPLPLKVGKETVHIQIHVLMVAPHNHPHPLHPFPQLTAYGFEYVVANPNKINKDCDVKRLFESRLTLDNREKGRGRPPPDQPNRTWSSHQLRSLLRSWLSGLDRTSPARLSPSPWTSPQPAEESNVVYVTPTAQPITITTTITTKCMSVFIHFWTGSSHGSLEIWRHLWTG